MTSSCRPPANSSGLAGNVENRTAETLKFQLHFTCSISYKKELLRVLWLFNVLWMYNCNRICYCDRTCDIFWIRVVCILYMHLWRSFVVHCLKLWLLPVNLVSYSSVCTGDPLDFKGVPPEPLTFLTAVLSILDCLPVVYAAFHPEELNICKICNRLL